MPYMTQDVQEVSAGGARASGPERQARRRAAPNTEDASA